MNARENLHVALANLKANKTRTLFSMLGIIIGTCAVIVVVSIVNGSRVSAIDQVRAGKDNMLVLYSQYSDSRGVYGNLNMDLVEKIKAIPGVMTAFPDVQVELNVRGKYSSAMPMVYGVDHFYTQLYQHVLLAGRFFTPEDDIGRPNICVISEKLSKKIFGFDYAVGQRIRLQKGTLTVVGIFKSEERLKRMDQSCEVIVPMNTMLGLIDELRIYAVQIRAMPGKINTVNNGLEQFLFVSASDRELYRLVDAREFYKDTEKWAKTWFIQMALVAAISLLVGGVGLMNVMLISVTERTHEIGLRKALGANSSMLLGQFLMESITLSTLGGIVGVISGVFVSYSLSLLSNNKILIEIMPLSIVVSFAFSLVIGVLFGLYPASKAARLSPVEALRYE